MATQDSVPNLDEEAIYAEALSELKSGTPRPGLWAKAFAESEGDEKRSQALYIKLRVQQERERRHQEQAAESALSAESERRKAEDFSAVIEHLRLKGYEAKKTSTGWTIREPLGGRVRLDSDKSLLEYAQGRVTVDSGLRDSSKGQDDSTSTSRRPDDHDLRRQPVDTRTSESISIPVQNTAVDVASESRKGPSGVGGWLLLLVAGMLVLGPLLGAGRINADIMTAEHQYPALRSLPQWSNFKVATWWTFLAIIAVSIYGGWGLARGRDWSVVRRAKLVLWIAGPVGALILSVVVPLATLGESYAGHAQFVGGLLASVIAAGIWTAYLLKSKRVRNTYGPPK